MIQASQLSRRRPGLLGIICGSLLVSVPAIAQPGFAQTNPCPGIFYEEPFNSTRRVPQGCPANAFGGGASTTGTTPVTQTPPAPSPTPVNPSPVDTTLPAPEQQRPPVATVTLTNGTVTVRLINETGAAISYQAIGDTQPRILGGEASVALRDLEVPTTVTFRRQDGGLLQVTPLTTAPGVLELRMSETTNLSVDRSTLNVDENGSAFLN